VDYPLVANGEIYHRVSDDYCKWGSPTAGGLLQVPLAAGLALSGDGRD
jgi:hypothetical protein